MRKLKLLLLSSLLCITQILWGQNQVTGKVTDERNGTAISGATITVKNSNVSTVTDENGNFSISVSPNATLLISHIGYAAIEVSASQSANISLAPGDRK